MKTFILIFLLNHFFADFSNSLRVGLKSSKSDPFSKMSDAELEKMLKEMGMSSKEIGALGTDEEKKINVNHEEKKKPVEKKPLTFLDIMNNNRKSLRNFELTQRDAFNLIYTIKKFPIFSRLPLTAMNLINDIDNRPSYKNIEELHKNKTEETNTLISNTLNSQIFIDHENKLGRKGILTIVDKETGKFINLWAVLNNKVFAFYKTSNFLKIKHIFRISLLKVRNTIYSPCFYLYYDNLHEEEKKLEEIKKVEFEKKKLANHKRFDPRKKTRTSKIIESMNDGKLSKEKLDKLKKMELPPLDDISESEKAKNLEKKNENEEGILPLNFRNSQLLVCALNFREKEYWLSTFYSNKELYKNFDSNNKKSFS